MQMRKGRKPFDIHARKVPPEAQLLLVGTVSCGLASCIRAFVSVLSKDTSDNEDETLQHVLGALPSILAGTIAWIMTWRDEIEGEDSVPMALSSIAAVAAQVLAAVDLNWATVWLLPVAHLFLCLRNLKALHAAWHKKLVPVDRAKELLITAACLPLALIVISFSHVRHGYGLLTTLPLSVSHMLAGGSVWLAWAVSYSERFPAVNSKEMLRAVVVLFASQVVRTASLALTGPVQVVCAALAGSLWATGIAAANVSTYRRTILKSKGVF